VANRSTGESNIEWALAVRTDQNYSAGLSAGNLPAGVGRTACGSGGAVLFDAPVP